MYAHEADQDGSHIDPRYRTRLPSAGMSGRGDLYSTRVVNGRNEAIVTPLEHPTWSARGRPAQGSEWHDIMGSSGTQGAYAHSQPQGSAQASRQSPRYGMNTANSQATHGSTPRHPHHGPAGGPPIWAHPTPMHDQNAASKTFSSPPHDSSRNTPGFTWSARYQEPSTTQAHGWPHSDERFFESENTRSQSKDELKYKHKHKAGNKHSSRSKSHGRRPISPDVSEATVTARVPPATDISVEELSNVEPQEPRSAEFFGSSNLRSTEYAAKPAKQSSRHRRQSVSRSSREDEMAPSVSGASRLRRAEMADEEKRALRQQGRVDRSQRAEETQPSSSRDVPPVEKQRPKRSGRRRHGAVHPAAESHDSRFDDDVLPPSMSRGAAGSRDTESRGYQTEYKQGSGRNPRYDWSTAAVEDLLNFLERYESVSVPCGGNLLLESTRGTHYRHCRAHKPAVVETLDVTGTWTPDKETEGWTQTGGVPSCRNVSLELLVALP